MRWFRRGRHANGAPPAPEPDPAAARAKAESLARLRRDQVTVIAPLASRRSKDNVTALARQLTGKRRPAGGQAAG